MIDSNLRSKKMDSNVFFLMKKNLHLIFYLFGFQKGQFFRSKKDYWLSSMDYYSDDDDDDDDYRESSTTTTTTT